MAAGLVKVVGSMTNVSGVTKRFAGGTTGVAGDLVVLKAGVLQIAGAAEGILGALDEAMTSASTSLPLVNITPGMLVIMDSSSTGIVSTDPGKYFDLSGGTGAQVIDITTRDTTYTTSSAKVFFCLEFNPQGYGSDTLTTAGLYFLHRREQ